MKITTVKAKPSIVTFGSLNVGDTFNIVSTDGTTAGEDLYIKATPLGTQLANAMNLSSSYLASISPNTNVIVVNCELNVK